MSDRIRAQFSRDIEPWLDRLYRAAFRLTQNRADAEELFQDTCIRAFSHRESFAASPSPLGWLMRVQYNLFIDETRKRKQAIVVSIGELDQTESTSGDEFDPQAGASAAQSFASIHEAWRKLSRSQSERLARRRAAFLDPNVPNADPRLRITAVYALRLIPGTPEIRAALEAARPTAARLFSVILGGSSRNRAIDRLYRRCIMK